MEKIKRPFTDVTDMIILQMIVEDKASAKVIAALLGREERAVTRRIKYLRKSGKFREIHNRMMAYNGCYARKFLACAARRKVGK